MKKALRKYLFLFRYKFIIKNKIQKTVIEKIGKFKFVVRPSVFNPKDYISSKIFADFVSSLDLSGKDILDMGTGSGIVSVFAASKGAKCLAADINSEAVESVNENTVRNSFNDKIDVVHSNLFENIPNDRKFDVIFFNPPYYKGVPLNDFERAFKGGNNLEIVSDFLMNAGDFLKNEGIIYLMVSSDADLDLFWILLQNGFRFETVMIKKKTFEIFYVIKATKKK